MPKRDDTQASKGLQMIVLFFVFLSIATIASVIVHSAGPVLFYIGATISWFIVQALLKRKK